MGLSTDLRKLTPVKKGESVLSVANHDRMNAIQNVLRALARGDNIFSGDNTRLRKSEGVVTISSDAVNDQRSNIILPFRLTVIARKDDPDNYSINIIDGKVNNEWPDVGTNTMGSATSPGYQVLDIANITDSNIFIRVMFNYLTFEIARIDIYERPSSTYPTNKIIFGIPIQGACDGVDDPNADPPAGYGRLNLLIGFTYVKPPAPPAVQGTSTAFNLILGNINFGFIVGAFNAQPALCPVTLYPGAGFIQVPTS